jgi:molybdenum cofactor synthesis domain-containing protein
MKPTAAILIIGNEILSGTTQDANIAWMGARLNQRGIPLMEVRIVRDDEEAIVQAVNELRKKYKYLFTTGGIGPTHDDITADCVAKAFEAPIGINVEARKRLEEHYASHTVELNEARLRMARIPVGGELINNPVTVAPGFRMENVFVLAGVPKIMQGMFQSVEGLLEGGKPVLSTTVSCNQKEGDIAAALGDLQKQYADIDIGSYPHMDETPSLSLILRGTDEKRLSAAAQKVAEIIRTWGEEPILEDIQQQKAS